jgi:hypothetical protein
MKSEVFVANQDEWQKSRDFAQQRAGKDGSWEANEIAGGLGDDRLDYHGPEGEPANTSHISGHKILLITILAFYFPLSSLLNDPVSGILTYPLYASQATESLESSI